MRSSAFPIHNIEDSRKRETKRTRLRNSLAERAILPTIFYSRECRQKGASAQTVQGRAFGGKNADQEPIDRSKTPPSSLHGQICPFKSQSRNFEAPRRLFFANLLDHAWCISPPLFQNPSHLVASLLAEMSVGVTPTGHVRSLFLCKHAWIE